MGINVVQFQTGLSMSEFVERYGTEAKCFRGIRPTPHMVAAECRDQAGSAAQARLLDWFQSTRDAN